MTGNYKTGVTTGDEREGKQVYVLHLTLNNGAEDLSPTLSRARKPMQRP